MKKTMWIVSGIIILFFLAIFSQIGFMALKEKNNKKEIEANRIILNTLEDSIFYAKSVLKNNLDTKIKLLEELRLLDSVSNIQTLRITELEKKKNKVDTVKIFIPYEPVMLAAPDSITPDSQN